MDNKRISPRMDMNIECELNTLSSPFSTCPASTAYHGTVMNMSDGGLSFSSSDDFPLDTWLDFRFMLDGQPFNLKACTIWSRTTGDTHLYGCKFNDFHVMEHLNCAFNLL